MIIKTLPLGNLGANCYYVFCENSAVLVDPGFFDDYFAEFLESLDVKPTAVLLTHGHFDHISGTMELAKKYDVTVYIGAADEQMLYSADKNLSAFVGGYPKDALDENVRVVSLQGGEVIEVGNLKFGVISLPGHTAGGVGYYISNTLFCGDTVFRGNIGRTDLPTGDFEILKKSIKKISSLPDDTVLYCGHGESTTVGTEKAYNPYFRFGEL